MAPRKKTELAQLESKQKRQDRLLRVMQKRENWLKWLIIGLLILVLLLILFFGYATDWTKGLRKDAATSNEKGMDTLQQDVGVDANAKDAGGGTDAAGTNNTSRTGTNTTTGNTARESSSTNTSTTTTNNSTTPGSSEGSTALLDLYNDTSAGDNIGGLFERAAGIPGVSRVCRTELLVQTCEFDDGTTTVTTKNIIGSGLITSVIRN